MSYALMPSPPPLRRTTLRRSQRRNQERHAAPSTGRCHPTSKDQPPLQSNAPKLTRLAAAAPFVSTPFVPGTATLSLARPSPAFLRACRAIRFHLPVPGAAMLSFPRVSPHLSYEPCPHPDFPSRACRRIRLFSLRAWTGTIIRIARPPCLDRLPSCLQDRKLAKFDTNRLE